ncbi:hypothetical protein OSC27_11205 [Microbacterium sp. STN6]|uniref:glycoside hydrolase family 38 N-terminal domain-containing protein n=1 Tax=Microbacterium sp. STN6 TaxID=2995588 RepID=UPI002260A62D|nr:hypothetical protein [Microbacterium sp. STN6]MCX7522842.1 hypothetical protein [Microbacterium sp. STN6]
MSSIRRILLLGHTHHDVGYTNSPRIIDPMHAAIVGHVLDLCDRHASDGPDDFRWTFEVARPVLRFMREAAQRPDGERDIERMRRRVAEGRISVTGGYLNMTQLPSQGEFDAAREQLDELRMRGIRVRTEQHGDVNGIAWGEVDGMLRGGIDRLVMALNPDHGRAPLEQPSAFWWEGPAGGRVFTLLSTHYGYGEEWGIVDGDVELAERRIGEFIARLGEREDWPFDTAIVHAGNDNRWPTALFTEVVRHWNARHPEVQMRTATIDDALDVLQAQVGNQPPDDPQLPVLRGEWSDWWAHGHGSTAFEVGVYRQARSFARAAQSTLALALLAGGGADGGETTVPLATVPLATVLGYRRGPVRLRGEQEIVRDLDAVDEQLLLFGEHTWGSWETYSKPHSVFSHSHRNAKMGFAYAAYDLARDLAIEGVFRVGGFRDALRAPQPAADAQTATRAAAADAQTATRAAAADAVVLVNTSERERTEPVEFEVGGVRRASVVATVPAFSVVSVPVPGPSAGPKPGRVIETETYRAEVDPAAGGVVSLVDKRTGRELIDGAAGHGLGALVAESVPPGSDHAMLHNPKNFNPQHPGPEFVRETARGADEPQVTATDAGLRVTWSSAVGRASATTTLSLYDGSDLIDLVVRLVKPATFEPESLFVAFPFAVEQPRFLLETAGAVYEADAEQLPDTSKDWYSIQHAVGVNGGTRAAEHGVARRAFGTPQPTSGGILWGAIEAPLVQLGGFHTGQWAERLEVRGGHVNSWVMNNLHFTNFQASQGGTGLYHYRFRPTAGPVRRQDVRVFGRDLLEPVLARVMEGRVADERRADAAGAPNGSGEPGGLREQADELRELAAGVREPGAGLHEPAAGLREPAAGLLSVEPTGSVLAELRPGPDGAVRVRLRNITGEQVDAVVNWQHRAQSVSLPPYGVGDATLTAQAARKR